MNATKIFGVSLVAGLAILCCAGPLLLVALGSVALSAWAASAGYVAIPIVLAVIGLVSIWRYRRNRSTSSSAVDPCTIDDNTRKLKS
jgi:hypothetical protein